MRLSYPVVVAMLVGLPTLLSAQTLRGKLLDNKKDPVAEAVVTLRDSTGAEIRTTRTDHVGVFHFAAPRPGSYSVSLARIGFEPFKSDPVILREGESLEIEIRVNANAAVLPTMVVQGRSRREWGRDGFAERQALGKGVFLLGPDITKQKTETVVEALGRGLVDGFRIIYRPFPELVNTNGRRCLQYMVNNQPIPRIENEMPELTLHHMLGPDHVMGIEVYREFREVPPVFRQQAFQSITPQPPLGTVIPMIASPDPAVPCGLINVWTQKAW